MIGSSEVLITEVSSSSFSANSDLRRYTTDDRLCQSSRGTEQGWRPTKEDFSASPARGSYTEAQNGTQRHKRNALRPTCSAACPRKAFSAPNLRIQRRLHQVQLGR